MTRDYEDYVSFETAKLLKEKGFDWKCHAMYDKDGHFAPFNFKLVTKAEKREFVADAPTLQMAMKWLRTKNIFIDIFHYNSKMAPFIWNIFAYNVLTPQKAETYEEATENSIKFVLENWDDVNKVLDEYYKYDKILPKI